MPRNTLATPPEVAAKIVASYLEGHSMSQVAEEFDISIQTVSNLLKAAGYEARAYTRRVRTTRRCLSCKATKPIDTFPRDRTRGDGKGYRCRECVSANYRRDLLKRHGLTPEEYDEMVAGQDGVCAICRKPETSNWARYLAVDHCHRTGKRRGLLCSRCNTAIGLFKDEPGLMMKACKYLALHMISAEQPKAH